MLIPRFTLRWMLATTAVCGLLAFVLSQAVAGRPWGIAISVAIGALFFTAVIYAMVFLASWGIAFLGLRARKRRAMSPFATHTAPPQILPPQDPV